LISVADPAERSGASPDVVSNISDPALREQSPPSGGPQEGAGRIDDIKSETEAIRIMGKGSRERLVHAPTGAPEALDA